MLICVSDQVLFNRKKLNIHYLNSIETAVLVCLNLSSCSFVFSEASVVTIRRAACVSGDVQLISSYRLVSLVPSSVFSLAACVAKRAPPLRPATAIGARAAPAYFGLGRTDHHIPPAAPRIKRTYKRGRNRTIQLGDRFLSTFIGVLQRNSK